VATRCLRLADSSIWIAFKRIGKLDLLLSMPGIAVARPVLTQLELGWDDLPERIERRLAKAAFDVDIDDGLAGTLSDVLQAKQRTQAGHTRGVRLADETDTVQLAYACVHRDTVALYMRDAQAERLGASVGARLRTHVQLLEDMIAEGLLSPEEAAEVMAGLDVHFARGKRPERAQ